ncbi:MAG TPA: hypothetical protein VJV23_00220 [Candidatus Polarisedimenticolia bacterium]|nr:hypothetical protein [Candidatus Polarisedimenticolia bacterium]
MLLQFQSGRLRDQSVALRSRDVALRDQNLARPRDARHVLATTFPPSAGIAGDKTIAVLVSSVPGEIEGSRIRLRVDVIAVTAADSKTILIAVSLFVRHYIVAVIVLAVAELWCA